VVTGDVIVGSSEQKLVKIALVGTHGVGKTTVAYELAGRFKRKWKTVELLTEIARECPFPLNDLATSAAYQWIIARQVQLEIEKSARADITICDRSVLDNFAYYVRRCGAGGEEYEALKSYCYSWMKTYDLLVRLRITEPMIEDGFRSVDEQFQREIDELCDRLFEPVFHRWTHPAYIVAASSSEQTADMILGSLGTAG
jgi:nicotinamide riboside kinase